MMHRLAAALACLLLPLALHAGEVEARIDISDQEMTVWLDGQPLYHWPVSTARAGKFTPLGLFSVKSMKRVHYSTLYHNAPMPWSIFFYGNFAIHGTDQTSRLGTPASAGCIRLHPDNARTLFELVQREGPENTLIHVVE